MGISQYQPDHRKAPANTATLRGVASRTPPPTKRVRSAIVPPNLQSARRSGSAATDAIGAHHYNEGPCELQAAFSTESTSRKHKKCAADAALPRSERHGALRPQRPAPWGYLSYRPRQVSPRGALDTDYGSHFLSELAVRSALARCRKMSQDCVRFQYAPARQNDARRIIVNFSHFRRNFP